ncbi:MAG TPA: hypothetical protein VJY63_01270 [Marinospirillum sp.]|uniref:hypothetical protein n=1 Tax=Marinospirillum sp. TaxID=2183934 RepID=UPI002B4749BA|nr:hypothetical protein [Marinospirillum sp.]HKM14540.1 hypothetical protein [Marinospirillum sp.]
MFTTNDELPDVLSNMLKGIASPLPRLTADQLESFLALTHADNVTNLKTTNNWLSNFNGQILKSMMAASYQQSDVFAPFGVPQELFTGWLKPLVKATQEAVAAGRDPDPVANDNLRIESLYASRIKRLVTSLTKEVKATPEELAEGRDDITRKGYRLIFDRKACDRVCTEAAGQAWLLTHLAAFQQLEWRYRSYGQTRLRAMKKLLRSLLQVIANEPLSKLRRNPYRKLTPEGERVQSDDKYLADCELRLLALLAHDAFDVRRFALEAPTSFLGACDWQTVAGSELYSVKLRHYPLPEGVKRNGRTLYMASPMINRCEIFDLAPGKSVVEGMLQQGYDIYMIDYGNPGPDQANLGLSFYGKTVHDKYLEMIIERHPEQSIDVMSYCMGGTLFMPYLARRIEELNISGGQLQIRQVVLMTAPIFFDDEESGHKPMRDVIREHYSPEVMQTFYAGCNVPPQTIEVGMHAIQPGVAFSVAEGFYARANFPGAIDDAAPFMHWLNSGTRFPARAHGEWIKKIFLDNEIWEGKYALPSKHPELDGKPVNMDMLNMADVALFDYRGLRDPIAPVGSCRTSERWGRRDDGNIQMTCGGLNRTIEKNVGHIFVVSKRLLGDFLESVTDFLHDEPPAYVPNKKAGTPDPCPPGKVIVEIKEVTQQLEIKETTVIEAKAPEAETKAPETKAPEAKPVTPNKKRPPAKR